jgi:hypothetical protein
MNSITFNQLKNSALVHVAILCLALVTCYYGLWNAYFASGDDFGITAWVMHQPTIVDAIQGYGNGVRFLNFGQIWIRTQFFGLNATPYYIASLLHQAVLVYIFYRLVEFWTGRRTTAFLAGLIFAVSFAHYEVVTSVSASDYSLWAIFYLTALTFFAVYLKRRSLPLYLVSIGAYAILALAHDFTLNLPLVLVAYHLTVGREGRALRSMGWSDLKLHFPYWFIFSVHVAIQLSFVLRGTSEAIYSEQTYGPGLHMPGNLFYLVFLLIPNVYSGPINNFLTKLIGSGQVELIWQLTGILAILAHGLAAFCFWKGSSLVKFGIALIYLPFLQYTLWQGDYAGANRYLFLPSLGFSLLLALLFIQIYDLLSRKEGIAYRLVTPAAVTIFLLANILVVQVWVQRHISNGKLRRAFTMQLANEFKNVEPKSLIYIEVPEAKFTDLKFACYLALGAKAGRCEAFVTGEHSLQELSNISNSGPVYWLQATEQGFTQIYPQVSASK